MTSPSSKGTRRDHGRNRYCRARSVKAATSCRTQMPMSNYHYSTPDPIPTRTLADMIVFYGSPEMRAEILIDEDLLETLVGECQTMIALWSPTSTWERDLVSHGRHLQWLIWQITNNRDESMVELYCDPDRVVEPWKIEIETLPDYRTQLPAPILQPGAE